VAKLTKKHAPPIDAAELSHTVKVLGDTHDVAETSSSKHRTKRKKRDPEYQQKLRRQNYLLGREQRLQEWFRNHRIIGFTVGVIVLSLVMTWIGLWLYGASGAARLDLSRPGFESAREKLQAEMTEKPYPNTGALDRQAINDFNDRFMKLQDQINGTSDFGEDVLSDSNLGISGGDASN
jgi:tetrahydromethanopterin S-methyltransferase subunit F